MRCLVGYPLAASRSDASPDVCTREMLLLDESSDEEESEEEEEEESDEELQDEMDE